ncbi:MAG: flavodoxin family protein [Candidatus Ozemobacteraceae bacterium]
MKFIIFQGSPRKSGNCAQLIQKVTDVLTKEKHEVKLISAYEQSVKGCLGCHGCSKGIVEYCVQKDDFTKLIPEIIAADGFIFASPVYMGHISGPLKTIVDRFFSFVKKDFSIRFISGKKCATIVTSGAPRDMYYSVTNYLKQWLGSFLKLNYVGGIHFGELTEPGMAARNPEMLAEAEKLAKSLL